MNGLELALPTLLVLTPIAGGLITMSMMTRTASLVASVLAFLVQATLVLVAFQRLQGDGPEWLVTSHVQQWFPLWKVNYDVALDYTSVALVGLVTLVTFCASVFAWHAGRERPAAFQGLLWLTAGSMAGMFLARDLVLFYVFYELMLIPLLFLVGGWGGAERVRAAMTMFVYTLVGSLLMLVGVIAVGQAGGTFSLPALAEQARLAGTGDSPFEWWMFATFVLAFAIKAPLMPFHGWLPLAYREAPAEVTAVLSGLVSKAAAFGFLIVVLPLFPAYMHGTSGTVITWVALAGLLYGSIAAFRQPDARGVVAYSSLAQMGLIVLGLSVYLGDGGEQGVAGATMQVLNHGLISAALFLLIGLVELRVGTDRLSRLGAIATGRPVLATTMLVVSLCALAVPGSNAFAGELLVLAGAFRAAWEHAWIYAALGGLGVVLAAMYVLRLLAAIMYSPGAEPSGELADGSPASAGFGGDIYGREIVAVLPLVVAMLVLSVWPNLARRAINDRPVPMLGAGASGAGQVVAATGGTAAGAPATEEHGG